MQEPDTSLALWDYRRRVQAIYGKVRNSSPDEVGWREWRRARDQLFASHPQSPVPVEARGSFSGLDYFDYNPAWRYTVEVKPIAADPIDLTNSTSGTTPFRRFGTARFEHEGTSLELMFYWFEGYGGGVFVPFRDATNGDTTYEGGRYLLDTAKGADLGHTDQGVVFDFNYAYHPSCVHDPQWSCPLPPSDNDLSVAVDAGERLRA